MAILKETQQFMKIPFSMSDGFSFFLSEGTLFHTLAARESAI